MHPKYKTPSFSTILTGVVVGVPALFLNLDEVVKLTSVGTLFAFVLVCGGIVRFHHAKDRPDSKFKAPYVSGKWIIPGLFLLAIYLLWTFNKEGIKTFFMVHEQIGPIVRINLPEKVPYIGFSVIFFMTAVLSFLKKYSLIPILGFLCCTYLLCESGTTNWERFILWLLIGLCIYFLYGFRNSKLGLRLKKERT